VESRGAPLGTLRPITLGVVEGTGPSAAPSLARGGNP
jgi:hypothetical protein